MKTLLIALLLLSSSAFADEMFISENYSIKIDASVYSPALAHIGEPSPNELACFPCDQPTKNAWRTEDTAREAVFQFLNIIDWGQTRWAMQQPAQCTYTYTYDMACTKYEEKESAWIIGSNPSIETVDTFMAASAVLHYGITRTLIYFDLREIATAFQYITIGGKLNATIGNASVGIKVSF